MSNGIQILADYRDEILLAEIAVWLHMLGKFHEEFIKGNHNLDRQIPGDLQQDFKSLDDLLRDQWPGKIWERLPVPELRVQGLSIFDLIKTHRVNREDPPNIKSKLNNSGFLRLVNDSHGRGSGSEKGVLCKDSYSPPNGPDVCMAEANGYEDRPIDLPQLAARKRALYGFLSDQLSRLKQGLLGPSAWKNQERLDQWREYRTSFIDRLKKDFSTTTGDTRRPVNDVSLWDQTATTVAFFKAELAEVLLNGWHDPSDKNNRFKYRFLLIRADGGAFISRSIRVADILARKALIYEAWDMVKNLVEVEYPLGFEIYRDINGIAFLTPNLDDFLARKIDPGQTLESTLKNRADEVIKGEVTVELHLSSKASRNVFYFGQELKAPPPQLTATPEMLAETWQQAEDKCTVCQVRPQGFGARQVDAYKLNSVYYREKALQRKICCICMNRMQGRSKNWCTEELDSTIWIDEIADNTGRVALVAGRLEIDNWLNGELMSSLSSLNLSELLEQKAPGLTFPAIANEFTCSGAQQLGNLPLYRKIGEKHAKTVQGLMDLLIADEDLGGPDYEHIPAAERLALAVWRKTPSFARLRRIWETTERFWEVNIENKLAAVVGTVGPRLILNGDIKGDNLGDFHVYEVVPEDSSLSFPFVWDSGKKHFISAFNLLYMIKLLHDEGEKKIYTSVQDAAKSLCKYFKRQGSLRI